MSSDDGYIISPNRAASGGYVAMWWQGDSGPDPTEDEYGKFPTIMEAYEWALRENTEYGVELDNECRQRLRILEDARGPLTNVQWEAVKKIAENS